MAKVLLAAVAAVVLIGPGAPGGADDANTTPR